MTDSIHRMLVPVKPGLLSKGRYTHWVLNITRPVRMTNIVTTSWGGPTHARACGFVLVQPDPVCPGLNCGLCIPGQHSESGPQIVHAYVRRPRQWVRDYEEFGELAMPSTPFPLVAHGKERSVPFDLIDPKGRPLVLCKGDVLHLVATTDEADEVWAPVLFGDPPEASPPNL